MRLVRIRVIRGHPVIRDIRGWIKRKTGGQVNARPLVVQPARDVEVEAEDR